MGTQIVSNHVVLIVDYLGVYTVEVSIHRAKVSSYKDEMFKLIHCKRNIIKLIIDGDVLVMMMISVCN